MDVMAVPQPGEEGPFPAPLMMQNRNYSLYASRIKPLVIDSNAQEEPPQVPDLPALPISPRWDSLSNGPHLLNQTTPCPVFRTFPTVRPEASPTQQFPVLAGPVVSPPPMHDPGPRRIIHSRDSGPRSASPSMSLRNKSSLADLRITEGSSAVENFSRPRKQSIRQNGPPDGIASPEPVKLPRLANLSNPLYTDRLFDMPSQTPPWQRSRRPSVSSVKSSCASPSPLPYNSGECVEPRSHRARNVTSPPALTPARTQMASVVSTPVASPGLGGAVPWVVGGDELRCSFRSQLTASTTPGTAVTERSSVLTKDSSVTSLENLDEPSLEDVMGMYEKGFADDEDDYDGRFGDGANEIDMESRPMMALAKPAMASAPEVPRTPAIAHMAENRLSPPLPISRSTLDAEIRQSKMLFTSPAFTSSVAAISGKADMDTAEKRDSAKSLDSEPSITTDPVAADKATYTTVASPSSTSPSRSPSPPPSCCQIPATPSTPTPPPPPPPTMPAEPEDPGSRDRYGFKKANQTITREQYDAWNKDYSFYLARRRRKWISYLKDCALMTDRPIRFPSPSAKTKRFVRKGIPPDWRGAAWFYYAGGPAILAKHAGLYEKLLYQSATQVDVEAIERDLHRTFPDNIQFKPSSNHHSTPSSGRSSQSTMTRSSTEEDKPPGPPPAASNEPPIITSLRRVLHAFSIYNPRIGYCQSLNFLAGLLLLFVETEEQCFWLLNVITIIYLPGTHDMSLEGSKVDLGVLMTELRDSMPSVWEKIGGELENLPTARPGTSKSARKTRPILRRREQQTELSTERLPPITLCMTAWFMSCYIGTLPIETTLRVWDVFFYEGSKTLFRIALAIFKTGESEIKAVKDPMEMFGVVQTIPRRMIDANGLMEACFKRRNGFGHLSQGTIDERRQARRDKAKQEREQNLLREKASFGGNLTEAESCTVSRRGTLFNKTKRDAVVRPSEV